MSNPLHQPMLWGPDGTGYTRTPGPYGAWVAVADWPARTATTQPVALGTPMLSPDTPPDGSDEAEQAGDYATPLHAVHDSIDES